MIEEKSISKYAQTQNDQHDLVTKSFIKKFAERSKNIFRAEQIDCAEYEYITIVTDQQYIREGFNPEKYIIDIKGSNSYDTTITWNLNKGEETPEQKSFVQVLCKGSSLPVYTCKYQKDVNSPFYYAFIIRVVNSELITIDVTQFGEKKNNLENWHIYPSDNLTYVQKENNVDLNITVKGSKYLLKGSGTKEDPYIEDLKYLNFEDISLDEYNELGETAYGEILYVKGTIPETQYYFNDYLITSSNECNVSGITFRLDKYIYYVNDLEEDYLEPYVDISSFTGHLKTSEACITYKPFINEDDLTSKHYDDITPYISSCLVSPNSNESLETISGVFDSTRALIAKEADNSKTTNTFKENKTINLDTDDFLTYDESSVSTNFENEVNLPKLNFVGSNIEPEDTFYNNFKVNKQGLITEAKLENYSGLPYEKNTDNLYFRIDPDKSIDDDNVSSVQNVTFAEFVSNLTIVGETTSNDVYEKKKIATITNNSGKDLECSFFTVSNSPSRILDMITDDSGFIPNNGAFTLMTQDEKYIGMWWVRTNGSASPGYVHDESYFTLFNNNEPKTSFVNDNGATCYYQWRTITIPAGSTNIYIKPESNISYWSFNGVTMHFYENYASSYEKYFKQFNGGADPYVKIKSSKNQVIIGNDGLKISCGDNQYKIQITVDGTITAGQVTE